MTTSNATEIDIEDQRCQILPDKFSDTIFEFAALEVIDTRMFPRPCLVMRWTAPIGYTRIYQ